MLAPLVLMAFAARVLIESFTVGHIFTLTQWPFGFPHPATPIPPTHKLAYTPSPFPPFMHLLHAVNAVNDASSTCPDVDLLHQVAVFEKILGLECKETTFITPTTWNSVTATRIANGQAPLSVGRVYSNANVHVQNTPRGAAVTPNRSPLHLLAIYTQRIPDTCQDPDYVRPLPHQEEEEARSPFDPELSSRWFSLLRHTQIVSDVCSCPRTTLSVCNTVYTQVARIFFTLLLLLLGAVGHQSSSPKVADDMEEERRILGAVGADLEHEPSEKFLTLSIRPTLRPRVPSMEGSLLQAAEEQPTPLAASVEVDAASISLPDVTPESDEDLVNYNGTVAAGLEHEPVDTAILTSSPPTPRHQVPATEGPMLQAAEEQPPLAASVDVDTASISLPDITPGEDEDVFNYIATVTTALEHEPVDTAILISSPPTPRPRVSDNDVPLADSMVPTSTSVAVAVHEDPVQPAEDSFESVTSESQDQESVGETETGLEETRGNGDKLEDEDEVFIYPGAAQDTVNQGSEFTDAPTLEVENANTPSSSSSSPTRSDRHISDTSSLSLDQTDGESVTSTESDHERLSVNGPDTDTPPDVDPKDLDWTKPVEWASRIESVIGRKPKRPELSGPLNIDFNDPAVKAKMRASAGKLPLLIKSTAHSVSGLPAEIPNEDAHLTAGAILMRKKMKGQLTPGELEVCKQKEANLEEFGRYNLPGDGSIPYPSRELIRRRREQERAITASPLPMSRDDDDAPSPSTSTSSVSAIPIPETPQRRPRLGAGFGAFQGAMRAAAQSCTNPPRARYEDSPAVEVPTTTIQTGFSIRGAASRGRAETPTVQLQPSTPVRQSALPVPIPFASGSGSRYEAPAPASRSTQQVHGEEQAAFSIKGAASRAPSSSSSSTQQVHDEEQAGFSIKGAASREEPAPEAESEDLETETSTETSTETRELPSRASSMSPSLVHRRHPRERAHWRTGRHTSLA